MHYDRTKLINLRDKLLRMIQKYKPELQNTLRYRMFQYCVPREIEGVTKYLALHNGTLNSGQFYTFDHKDYNAQNIKHTIKLTKQKESKYFFRIQHDNQAPYNTTLSMYRDEDKRNITYQDKLYKEISQSGNVYAHLLSQYDNIQQRTNCDANNNIITPEEKIILEITHLFHDIPEKGTLEICNNDTKDQGKTHKEKIMEKDVAEQIIQKEDILSKDEKAILLAIYQQGEQKSHIFKFFERLRRIITDTKIIYEESEHLGPNRDKVFGEMAIGYITRFTKEYELPSGKKIQAIQLPSVQQTIKDNKDRLDFQIDYTYKNCFHKMHPEKQAIADENTQLRQQIKQRL